MSIGDHTSLYYAMKMNAPHIFNFNSDSHWNALFFVVVRFKLVLLVTIWNRCAVWKHTQRKLFHYQLWNYIIMCCSENQLRIHVCTLSEMPKIKENKNRAARKANNTIIDPKFIAQLLRIWKDSTNIQRWIIINQQDWMLYTNWYLSVHL